MATQKAITVLNLLWFPVKSWRSVIKERFRLADSCESQIGVLKVEPDLPLAMLFFIFHLYPTKIRWKRWRSLRSNITEIIFSILEMETSWKTFCCCYWNFFFPFFFFYITSQRLKDKPKNWLEGKSSGSILILLQIYFRFISQQTLQFYTSNKAGMPIWIKLSCNCP